MMSIYSLIDQIDSLLPQTQCTQCGYSGCRPYAEAIAQGTAKHNQCPPGGAEGIKRLSALLGVEALPLNQANGIEQPRILAVIDSARCIGCTLCIQACPVDAIVGAPKYMHVVLEDQCTGCRLCINPCPVDFIDSVTVSTYTGWQTWTQEQSHQARLQYQRRQLRLEKKLLHSRSKKKDVQISATQVHTAVPSTSNPSNEQTRKHALIEKVLARVQKQVSKQP